MSKLQKRIATMEKHEYTDVIPKMIHWVYDNTLKGSYTMIVMTWFKHPKDAEQVMKDFIDDGGLELCHFTNDYTALVIDKDPWTIDDFNNLKNKNNERKKRTNRKDLSDS